MNEHSIALKLMTYNIRVDDFRDGTPSWSQRRKDILLAINFLEPDILCIQEALKHQIADIEKVSAYSLIGWGRDDGEIAGEYSAILYKNDRFSVNGSGSFWLSPTPCVPSYGWGANHRRMATWAHLHDTSVNRTVLILCTHLDHEFALARIEGVKVMLKFISETNTSHAVVVAGDFNEEPGGQAYEATSTILRDSRIICNTPPSGPENTFNGFSLQNIGPHERIDYIFVGGQIEVDKHTHYIAVGANGDLASDHNPVFVELAWLPTENP